MDRLERRQRRDERLLRTYLLLCAVLLVPIALSYGIAPAEVLPKLLDIRIESTDQTQIFRALMCLYLAASGYRIQAGLAATRRGLGDAVLRFARDRAVSLLVDGPASHLLDLYLALEIIGAALGLAVLAYTRPEAA